MISKTVYPQQWFRDYPVAHLLDVHSRGIEASQLQKIAASEQTFGLEIRPEKGYGFLHLITMGAGERYGSNANADYFNKEARVAHIPKPCKGCSHELRLKGGLRKFHPTFMKYGHVYRDHRNSRHKAAPLGDIVCETFNPVMDRGELIVKLPEDNWRNELQKLARGEQVGWSMGTGVPADFCSICGNRAPTKKDYCYHMKFQKMAILDDGHQVFCYNDEPHFHDISCVSVPADRIALTLQKVASGQPVALAVEEVPYIPLRVIEKIGSEKEQERSRLLGKLAEIEKRVEVEGQPVDGVVIKAMNKDLPEGMVDRL